MGAHAKAPERHRAAYAVQLAKAKPSWLDDWRFIWADRTLRGERRSWIQCLLGW